MQDERTWEATRRSYGQAATWFTDVVSQVEGDWDRPGLGEWTVRDLVGHTSRSLSTVEDYIARPAARVEVSSAVDYYRTVMAAFTDSVAVAGRGRSAGAALGNDPAAAVGQLSARVLALVAATAPDAVVTSIVGGMRLHDYLPTRTFELTVHTCDLAAALDLELVVPEAAAQASLALASGLAVEGGRAGDVLLAVTGRRGLPTGFTVL